MPHQVDDALSSARAAWRVTLAYVLFGVAWILASDALIQALSGDRDWLDAAQQLKGLAFIVLTGTGLFLFQRHEYRRMRSALALQQRQFRQLHESLGEVLWIGSADGQHLHYVSSAFEQVYGRPVGDILHRPALWRESVHPEDLDAARALDPRRADGHLVSCEYRIVRPDGSVRWVEDRKRMILDANGRPVLMGGIAEDITARRERDAAQTTLHVDLQRLVDERTAELQATNLELEAFSRTAAHDLKSPLSGIAGLSQLLRAQHAQGMDAVGLGFLEQIERSARDMSELVNDLLGLSRAGSVALACGWNDLAPTATRVLDDLRRIEPWRPVVLQLPDQMSAWCDAGLMRSVLANLLGNAWKYSARREPARITVEWQEDAHGTRLTVIDNGSGFDAGRVVDGVFRPFQRFHTQAQFQGSGLGLVTCQRIAQRHGGRLEVQSAPGEGTRASLWLPLPAA
ncbi:PAS domain-containing protein [Ideonella sp. 4Y11]|uniref:histidine kinase n=1 Tax=Ideonella aquatica TaxID=2824119 RepID=A0A940YR26_9BURK|nr:PAS domain-containing sensor histidine kinase [Ideonella aquatica]MBQ0957880.1 PAS domain-containing protein [Ideonella aquatica]